MPVTITEENPGEANHRFRAVAEGAQSEGPTMGAALDALIEQTGGVPMEGMIILPFKSNRLNMSIERSNSPPHPAPSALPDRSA